MTKHVFEEERQPVADATGRPPHLTARFSPVSAGHPEYAEAIASYSLLTEISPARTVIARSTGEVQAAVRFAREQGLQVSVIATGHSVQTSRPLDGALLIRTAFDERVEIDPVAHTATVPAGARWTTVVDAAAVHSLAVLHGSSGDVGAIGYLLRGGISFYGREYGVAANSVLSITLVQADGTVVTTSADEDPELFWAIRGGGGGFGVVTSVTVALYPTWRVYTGITVWDAEHATDLALAWHEWTRTAPREVSTSFRILNLPPVPGVPSQVVGRTVVAVDGAARVAAAHLLNDRTGEVDALLAPLHEIAAPLLDDWALRGTEALPATHMDPPLPLPYVGDHALVSGLTNADLARLVELAGPGSGSTLTAVELRQLGGAFNDPPTPGGAFHRTDADFAFLAIGAVGGPVTADTQHATMMQLRAALAHRDTGYTLPTFVESTTQPSRTFDERTRALVERARTRVDPDGLFAASIVPFVIRRGDAQPPEHDGPNREETR